MKSITCPHCSDHPACLRERLQLDVVLRISGIALIVIGGLLLLLFFFANLTVGFDRAIPLAVTSIIAAAAGSFLNWYNNKKNPPKCPRCGAIIHMSLLRRDEYTVEGKGSRR